MSTTDVGRAAEQRAAQYLVDQGYVIVERNWRTRYCELDIVARRGDVVHVVEVKYRASARWGAALEYISFQKARRLERAALAWCQAHAHAGPYQIDVMAVEGSLTAPKIQLVENAVTA